MDFHDFVGSSSSGRIFRSNALKVMKIEDLIQNRLRYNLVYDLFHFETLSPLQGYTPQNALWEYIRLNLYHSNSSFFQYKCTILVV